MNAASAPAARILLVEDRESLRRMLSRALAGEGYAVAEAGGVESALQALAGGAFDLVLTDLRLPDGSGIDVVSACRRASPPPPAVVLTAYGTVGAAVEAMKLGALDFLEKPVEIEDLFALVRGVVGPDEGFLVEPPGGPVLVGQHPRMRAALHLLGKVASTDSTVLLTGESGTGKELFARALHAFSPRREAPFVAVNCAAIPETLLENELFGHEKGAFTGADRRQPGRFELAGRGTLLLDEVGELTPPVQAKVLRVLDERTYERVGGGSTLRAEARVVAATNRDLSAMVAAGSFRSDLYYRLEVFPIVLPPLRERATDVPLLARHLLDRLTRRHGLAPASLAPEAEALLARQPWPGNVRQLANVLERALILAGGGRIGRGDLEPLLRTGGAASGPQRLREALLESEGDKHRAAALLGVSYRTLLRRVKEFGLEGFPKYRS